MEPLGIENQGILEALKLGLVGYLIMIVLSTSVTYWMSKHIRSRSTQIIVISIMLLIFNLTFVATNSIIQHQVPKASESVSSIVGVIVALTITVPSGLYLKNFNAQYSGLETEIEHIDDDDFTDSVFEEKRHKRRRKSHKRK